MKQKFLWIVAFSLSLLLGQATLAHAGPGGMKKMVESLHLDETQKAKVTPILEQLKSSMKSSASQMRDLQMQINQQVTSDSMNQDTMNGLIDKKSQLIGDMMKAKMTATHQIYMLLNAQQKAAYQNMMKQWEEKMSHKFSKMHDDEE